MDGMVPITQSQLLATALQEAGGSVVFLRLPTIGHGWDGPPGSGQEVNEALFRPTIEFLDAQMKKEGHE